LSRDGWGGLVLLGASLLLFWSSLDLKDSPLVPIGPGFYPRIILGITVALALWLIVADLLAKRVAVEAPKEKLNYLGVVIHFAVFGLYVGALPMIGFRLSTFVYVAAANALMDPPKGWKGWLRVLLLALLTAGLSWLVFERYLSVLMPRGRWTGF
jgi:putative tricarboxylic transport membrane protein